jgi:hypothetical protein
MPVVAGIRMFKTRPPNSCCSTNNYGDLFCGSRGGDTVLISGTNFSTNAPDNIVTINGTTATVVSGIRHNIDDHFSARFCFGKCNVTVKVNGLAASYTFAYTRPVIVSTFAGAKFGFGYKEGKGTEANFWIPDGHYY